MNRSLFVATLAFLLLLAACGPAATATPTPVDISALQTHAVGTALAALTQNAPTATATLAATSTPVATLTPDFSVIKFDHIYFSGSAEMVIVFTLNGASGEFHVVGNNYTYECGISPDNANLLLCRGKYQASGREVNFKLYDSHLTDPVLTVDTQIPSLFPPTPVGMRCEIEPLWVAPLTGPYGCYAITCYLNGTFVNEGTPNTCDEPWRYGPVP